MEDTLLKTKEKLLFSAKELIVEKGFDRLSIMDITNHAKVGKGTYYTYFDTKYDIVYQISEEILKELLLKVDEINTKDKNEILNQLIDMIFEYTKENTSIIRGLYQAFMASNRLDIWENLFESLYNKVEKILFDEESSENNLKAQLIVGIIEQSAEQSYIFRNESSKVIQLRKKYLKKILLENI